MTALTVDQGLVEAVRRERTMHDERVSDAEEAILATIDEAAHAARDGAADQDQALSPPLLLDVLDRAASRTRLDVPTVKVALWGLVDGEQITVDIRGRVRKS